MGALDAPNAAFARIYVNLNAEFEGDSLRNTYGPAKFDRLRKDQGGVRPDERFRHNANIPPA